MANSEIIIGFLNEHTKKCPYQQVSSSIRIRSCTLCNQINRDITLLIANIRGARKTIDVGIAIVPCENIAPYIPYKLAGFKILMQNGTDEPERIKNILSDMYKKGYKRIILISNRVPNLPIQYIENAIEKLRDENKFVLGPLQNGMFYLLGLRRNSIPVVLNLIDEHRFQFNRANNQGDFIDSLKSLGIKYHLLPEWYLIKSMRDIKKLYIDYQNGTGWKARWTHDYLTNYISNL